MPKEILLYSSIYSYSVADFITQMEAAKGEDVVVRINTPGGVVMDMYGAVAKFNEHPKAKLIKVDGRADSSGAFMCCYAENVECLDVSTFMFHRAAWPEWVEANDKLFTEDMRAELDTMNAQLRSAMEGKMKAEDFQKVTGVSYDDLFSLDSRIDVTLDAKQAKKLGLVNKINTITPAKKAEIESLVMAIAAQGVPNLPEAEKPQQPQPKNTTMTVAEFKAAHPAEYAAIVNEGVTAERDRVGSLMAYHDVDPEAISKLIKEGGALSLTATAELNRKAYAKDAIAGLSGASAGPVQTGEPAQQATAEEKKSADFEAETRKALGLKAATA